MNNCKPDCEWLVHCLAQADGSPIAVRFCGNCEKVNTVCSSESLRPSSDPRDILIEGVLSKIFVIADVDRGAHDFVSLTKRQAEQVQRLAQVAKATCARAKVVALDFTCADCLTKALQGLPIEKIAFKLGEEANDRATRKT